MTRNDLDVLNGYNKHVLLKKGGQKTAYLVEDKDKHEFVLKIGSYESPASLERIRREVGLLKNIDSEYYPKNYDFQIISKNRFIILEEHIPSKPLSTCFNQFPTPVKVLNLIRHLVNGLNILWEKSVVHRDIKPDNILITANGFPKIIDLGIARLLDLDSLTYTLAFSGPCTPIYAAPEQLQNRKTDIDHRTDQFNIGIIMLQLLLQGKHPFDPDLIGSGESIVSNILAGTWSESILETPEHSPLQPLAKKLLGREPYQRYRRTKNLLSEIDQCLEVLQ